MGAAIMVGVSRAIRIVHALAYAVTLVVDAVLLAYSLTIIGSMASEAVTGFVIAPALAILGGLSLLRPRGMPAVAFIVTSGLFGLLLIGQAGGFLWSLAYLLASVTGMLQYRFAVPATPPASQTADSQAPDSSP
jgi:hypothetical protein